MPLFVFVLAYLVRLRDGTYAVRSPDYPGCEGRDPEPWPAREHFRRAISDRIHEMIEQSEVPVLYRSHYEIKPIFLSHCKTEIPAPDRLPNTYDYGVIEHVALSPEGAERLTAMLAAPSRRLLPTNALLLEANEIVSPDEPRFKAHQRALKSPTVIGSTVTLSG